MRLAVLQEGTVALTWDVGDDAVRIGRAASNDLVLPHTDVSGHHAVIEVVDGALRLTDLRSSNGTWVGGERIRGTVGLSVGDEVRLGAHATLVVLDEGCDHGALLLERADGLAAWPVRASGLTVPGTSAELWMDGGALWLATGDGDDEAIRVGEPFELDGVRFVVRASADAPTTQRLEAPDEIGLHVDSAAWRAVLEGPGARCVFDADHRVALLQTLGSRWLEDGERPDGGWVPDNELTVAVWGRKHRDHLPNNLHVLVHRVRKEAASAGLTRGFVQKRAGRTRLRVGRVVLR